MPVTVPRFGYFLRTAVGDSEAAEALECEAELIEAEQVALSGAKKVSRSSASGSRRSGESSNSRRSGNPSRNEQVESAAHQWMMKGGHRNEKANASKRRLSNCLKAVFAALCLLLSFSAGLFIYFTTSVEEHMHQIAAASAVRTDSARAAALVLAAQVPHLDVCGLDLPSNISRAAKDMEHHHRYCRPTVFGPRLSLACPLCLPPCLRRRITPP